MRDTSTKADAAWKKIKRRGKALRLSGNDTVTRFGNSLKMGNAIIIKACKQGNGDIFIVLKSLSQ